MIEIPKRKKGRQSAQSEHEFNLALDSFYKELIAIDRNLPFKVSSRGWCYLLEEHGLTKGDFQIAQSLINGGRKTGGLPIDFTALDDSRSFDALEYVDTTTPESEADYIYKRALQGHLQYQPVSFWEYQPYYIELVVEKIDLKSMFLPLCEKFNIPVANAKGWSDINMRNLMIQRFMEAEYSGSIPVLLYCGDHDPAGINISNSIRKNLNDLEQATGWNADKLVIDRFGLNYDFIQENNLSWVDNLETGSGKDLSNPNHKDHDKAWVQNYINKYGARKVEANALITRINEGIELFKSTLDKYLNYDAIDDYETDIAERQGEVAELVKDLMRAA